MSRKKDEASEAPPVPALTLDPPAEPVATLPGPAPEVVATPEAEVPARRRRRKRKPEPTPPPAGVTPEDLERCTVALAATFDILSKVVAKRRGPHWVFDGEECQTLGSVWTTALAPYLPRVGAAVPWAAAAAVTFSMLKPRLEQDAALASAEPAPDIQPVGV